MSDQPITRNELHFRNIDMRGYERSDGLFEVEGRLVDRKQHDMESLSGGRRVSAGDPIHDMGVRITFDKMMLVHAVETFTDAAPYAVCPAGGDALQTLVGLSMTKGWSRHVSERLSGARSCTHLMQLLMPMATVAFQSMYPSRRAAQTAVDPTGRPLKIGSCYAYGARSPVVKQLWPEYHQPERESGD